MNDIVIFVKYPERKLGLRIVTSENQHGNRSGYIEHNKLPEPGDEVFEGNINSLRNRPALKELLTRLDEIGNNRIWSAYFLQHLLHYHARHVTKKRRRMKVK